MNNQELTPPPLPSHSTRLPAALFLVVLFTAMADYLLWPAEPGLSLALYGFALIATLTFLNREKGGGRVTFSLLLLAGTCLQAANEVHFWTWIWLGILLIHGVSGIYRGQLPHLWARWSEACWALIKAPLRWLWLIGKTAGSLSGNIGAGFSRLWQGLCIVVPALVLAVIFLIMLSFGNAVLGHGIGECLEAFFRWLWEDLSFLRLLFWMVVATGLLAAFQPAKAAEAPRFWTLDIGKFRTPPHREVACWRSRVILLVLNLLFLAANGIDGIYLWGNSILPEGVTYSRFVHQGVYCLIASVLLAAVVLTFLFQQAPEVTRASGIRTLAHFWIAQNLLLVLGVLLRLRLYVETYQLSELRIGVALFLLLVGTGLFLLAVYVQKEKEFRWLLGRSMIATLVLTYVLQFADLAGIVASCNVRRWQSESADPVIPLDVAYLASLGFSAWPWLQKVAEDGRGRPESEEARVFLQSITWSEDWRSWQMREVRARRQLKPTPVKTDLTGTVRSQQPTTNDK